MTEFTLIAATGTALPAARENRHWIGGAWRESASWFERASPAHGAIVSRSALGGRAEAEAAVAAARAAFDDGRWSARSGRDRAAVLLRAAALIEERAEAIALMDMLECGKPITQSRGEVTGAADLWRHAAALARTVQGDTHNTLGPEMLGLVLKEPIGVVAIVTPWNFPFWILSQKLPYALAAGCTCVVKPSELTPSSAVMLAELLTEAGLPDGVVNVVLGYGDPVGMALTADPRVEMISFTGSTAVGKAIAATAAGNLKKCALELGGKNPQVIFPDADLDSAADAVTFGLCFNAGECCNAGSRVIVHREVASALTQRVARLARRVAMGDPLHPDTQVGALISEGHAARIDAHVQDARAAGAGLRLGGAPVSVPGLPGPFYAPTLLDGVTPAMAVAREEVFGPVLAVLEFETLEEAVALANDASYGLSAGVWSENVHTCLVFARGVRAGTIWTNTWMDGFPELTFGGYGESGQGREIGRYGMEEFLEVKSVAMRLGRSWQPWVR